MGILRDCYSLEVTPSNRLLVGPPRVGKTRVLQKTMALLPRLRFGGFFCRQIPQGSGSQLVLVEGRHRELADGVLARPLEVPGMVAFDSATLLDEGVPAIERALAEAQVVVIDQIGDFEASHPEFQAVVRRAFEGPRPVLATCPVPRPPLARELAERNDTLEVSVETGSRALRPQELADALVAILGSARSAPPARRDATY